MQLQAWQAPKFQRKSLGWTTRAWLFIMPLMALPNLGLGRVTVLGSLDLCDYLILPWILCLLLDKKRNYPCNGDKTAQWCLIFLAWAFFGVLTINLRYPYALNDLSATYLSFGKLAKLALYGFAAFLVVSRIKELSRLIAFHWALLASIVVVSLGLILSPSKESSDLVLEVYGYKSVNGIALVTAVLVCYVALLAVAGFGTRKWRWAATFASILGITAVLISSSRGAWLASICAMLYFLMKRGLRKATIVVFLTFALLLTLAYAFVPVFKTKVDFTLNPELRVQTREATGGIGGVDEGNRVESWEWEAAKYPDAPFWGAGFFHRGGLSRLGINGSHNFFLQMFLETGLIGGVLMLWIFFRMWIDAGAPAAREAQFTIPLRASIIAAMVGAMGGEYFYGGFPVLAMIFVYASTAVMPAYRLKSVNVHRAHAQAKRADHRVISGAIN